MSIQETFENLLNNPESSVLDFKKELYNFSNDNDATAKFTKDIISFCNTIRNTSAFIIFGIKENERKLEFVGLEKSIDDAILQSKIKDKVFPRPVFTYFSINYEGKLYGLIEIPIHKYELPIMPSKPLKGLELGKVYYRNGTANTEANGIDVIRINDWLKSLNGVAVKNLNEEISKILSKVVQGEIKLSVILTELLPLCIEYKLNDLKEFVEAELKGYKVTGSENYNYRVQKIFLSFNQIEVSPYSMINVTASILKKELLADKDTYEQNFFFNQPIVKIEDFVEQFKDKKETTFATYKVNSKELFEVGNYPMNVYFFENNVSGLYNNIRQKLVDLLMKI